MASREYVSMRSLNVKVHKLIVAWIPTIMVMMEVATQVGEGGR